MFMIVIMNTGLDVICRWAFRGEHLKCHEIMSDEKSVRLIELCLVCNPTVVGLSLLSELCIPAVGMLLVQIYHSHPTVEYVVCIAGK